MLAALSNTLLGVDGAVIFNSLLDGEISFITKDGDVVFSTFFLKTLSCNL